MDAVPTARLRLVGLAQAVHHKARIFALSWSPLVHLLPAKLSLLSSPTHALTLHPSHTHQFQLHCRHAGMLATVPTATMVATATTVVTATTVAEEETTRVNARIRESSV